LTWSAFFSTLLGLSFFYNGSTHNRQASLSYLPPALLQYNTLATIGKQNTIPSANRKNTT
jgi:hypothetical protein